MWVVQWANQSLGSLWHLTKKIEIQKMLLLMIIIVSRSVESLPRTGTDVGRLLGDRVGLREGLEEGDDEGLALGDTDGSLVGIELGAAQ